MTEQYSIKTVWSRRFAVPVVYAIVFVLCTIWICWGMNWTRAHNHNIVQHPLQPFWDSIRTTTANTTTTTMGITVLLIPICCWVVWASHGMGWATFVIIVFFHSSVFHLGHRLWTSTVIPGSMLNNCSSRMWPNPAIWLVVGESRTVNQWIRITWRGIDCGLFYECCTDRIQAENGTDSGIQEHDVIGYLWVSVSVSVLLLLLSTLWSLLLHPEPPPHQPPCTGSRPVTTLLWRVMNILRLCDSLCVHSLSCSVLCISSQNARVAVVVINWDVALNWMGCNQRTAKRTVQFQLFVWHRTEQEQKARLHSHVQPDSITFKWWWWSLLITSLGGYQLYVRWLVLLCCCWLAFCRILTRRRGSFYL